MIEFDPAKNAINRAKHGLDFEESRNLFSSVHEVFDTVRIEDEEQRFKAIGVYKHRIHIVVFTWWGERRRIISFRKANAKEIRQFRAITGRPE